MMMFIAVLGAMWFICMYNQEREEQLEGQLTEEQIRKKNQAEGGLQLVLMAALGLSIIWVSLGW